MRLFRITMGAAAATSALVLGTVAPAQAATQVALWHMGAGSTMSDASGHGHTGSLHNVTVGQAGWSGSGYGFKTKPSYVSVPSATDLNPGTSNFSVTVHVKFSVKPSSSVGDYDLIRKGLSTTSGGSWKAEILQSGVAFCDFRGSSGEGSISGGPNLANNTWHTITCARTSSSVKLTVDGASYTKSKVTGTISNTSTVLLGAKDTGGGDQYAGLMDEVSVSKG
jgi:hypothetical protein